MITKQHRKLLETKIRPTSAKVLSSLSNIIRNNYSSFTALDLFAGTGKVSLLLANLGATYLVCNDILKNDTFILNISKIKNIKVTTYLYDYHQTIKILGKLNSSFDIIYIDPPYFFNSYLEIIELIKFNNLLSADGSIILEIDSNKTPLFAVFNHKLYNYGSQSLVVIKKECL